MRKKLLVQALNINLHNLMKASENENGYGQTDMTSVLFLHFNVLIKEEIK
jgi:hypothetical protein